MEKNTSFFPRTFFLLVKRACKVFYFHYCSVSLEPHPLRSLKPEIALLYQAASHLLDLIYPILL